jgi:hypothetical protein
MLPVGVGVGVPVPVGVGVIVPVGVGVAVGLLVLVGVGVTLLVGVGVGVVVGVGVGEGVAEPTVMEPSVSTTTIGLPLLLAKALLFRISMLDIPFACACQVIVNRTPEPLKDEPVRTDM